MTWWPSGNLVDYQFSDRVVHRISHEANDIRLTGRKVRNPVSRDVDATGDPHLVVRLHVIEEAFECGDARRPADQPAVQPDRQHLRRTRHAFGVEHVECVAQMCEELVAASESARAREPHVVGVQCVGHHQVVGAVDAPSSTADRRRRNRRRTGSRRVRRRVAGSAASRGRCTTPAAPHRSTRSSAARPRRCARARPRARRVGSSPSASRGRRSRRRAERTPRGPADSERAPWPRRKLSAAARGGRRLATRATARHGTRIRRATPYSCVGSEKAVRQRFRRETSPTPDRRAAHCSRRPLRS